MSVVYPGIDEVLIDPAPRHPWAGRLLYVGRIDRQKGIDTAIRALGRLDAASTLEIWGTGDGAYIAECRALAAQLGVGERVRWRGWADPARRTEAYRMADAVVFPVRWEEPFGLVPVEAMAVGRPVISTARGGTAEYLRDGDNALVFAADDDAGLAACVRRLGGDEGLRGRLTEGGVRTAHQFTLTRFASDTVAAMLAAVTPRP
jgi:glycosyltransferase involved in cell wall biosynthesis